MCSAPPTPPRYELTAGGRRERPEGSESPSLESYQANPSPIFNPHIMHRRSFLCCSAAAATGLFLTKPTSTMAIPPVIPPDAEIEALARLVLEAAQKKGATYADIRISRHRSQNISTRERQVQWTSDQDDFGFGLRVIVDGAWGFASNSLVTRAAVLKGLDFAIAIARANAPLQRDPVRLAATKTWNESWRTPIDVNPFDVPLQDKIDLLLAVNEQMLKTPGVRYCESSLFQTSEEKFFASTEGTVIHQDIFRIWPAYEATAVSADGSDFQSCTGMTAPMGRGYEYVREFPLMEDARRAGADAVAKLTAEPITPGTRDLVLMPSHLWLVIHESIGHATELDRALGFEANYAGTSFVTPDNLGKLEYGSPAVHVVGDRTEKHGLATVGFDDDGVKATRFDIIRDGQFVGYQTTREQAHWVGDTESHGCAYADNYGHVPMQRMPNVSLMPSKGNTSPQDLISGIDDGVLIHGDGSWSIDQQRRNFQFGGQVFYKIKGGKIDGVYRDVAFQAMTLDFWRSCDAVCSSEHYALGGSYWCGKAQPGQVAPVSHGSAPARFRGVRFINTAA